MAVKPLRRIGAPVSESLYDRMAAQFLRSLDWRPVVDAFEQEHADLIVRDGENLLAALPRGVVRLLYGYENERAFAERFPAMFDELLPKVRRSLRADTLAFRLEYAPARPRIEPVLKNLSFHRTRDWLRMALPRTSRLPASPPVKGARLRPGGLDDFDEVLRIDREAFPDVPISADAFAAGLSERGERLLIAAVEREPAAFCQYSMPEPGTGYITILAVIPAFRERGLGAALTLRAARELFTEGALEVGLRTDEENRSAIRLYVKLGFKQTSAGRDYERPADPRAVERMREEARGTLIRFGGWR